jgi:hypothetical protein
MLCLGLFVFSLDTLSYQDLQRRTSWKHPTQSIVGGRDTSQFLGYGEDIIPSGSIVPEFKGKRASLEELRSWAIPAWPSPWSKALRHRVRRLCHHRNAGNQNLLRGGRHGPQRSNSRSPCAAWTRTMTAAQRRDGRP